MTRSVCTGSTCMPVLKNKLNITMITVVIPVITTVATTTMFWIYLKTKILLEFGSRKHSQKELSVYEKIVHWKKNLFMLPSVADSKRYVEKVTRLMKLWIQHIPLKSISLKGVYVMLALLLQKPKKSSKAKGHVQALERRKNCGTKVISKSYYVKVWLFNKNSDLTQIQTC